MRTYLFHVFQRGGAALSFEVQALAADQEAIAHAQKVLQEHRSAQEVEVWDDARLVHKAARVSAWLVVDGPDQHDGDGLPAKSAIEAAPISKSPD